VVVIGNGSIALILNLRILFQAQLLFEGQMEPKVWGEPATSWNLEKTNRSEKR
jgi:hypothetical protein